MDWKHKRNTQISGIMLTVFIVTFSYGMPKNNVLKQYDIRIRKESSVLDSIRIELEKSHTKIEELKSKEGSYLERLNQLEQNMQITKDFIEQINNRIDTVNSTITLLEDSLEQASQKLVYRQKKMAFRLKTMYKTGKVNWGYIVISSVNISDILNKIRYFQELKNYDQKLLNKIKQSKKNIAEHKNQLEEQKEQLTALRSVKKSQQDELLKEKSDKKEMLATIQKEKNAHIQMLNELELAQKQLSAIIRTLEKKKRIAKKDIERAKKIAFEKRKGKLPWPVEGTITKKFGKIIHPIYKTVTMNAGVDFKTAKGTVVECVAPGVVDYAGWMRGYGKFLIVNHSGGFVTIYAHLEKFNVVVNQKVLLGTNLGIVGDTGSLNGLQLHFEIRKGASPVNPEEWLEKKDS